MDGGWYFLLILGTVLLIYLSGELLITAYFRRKEEFVDRLARKAKGSPNGTRE